MLADDVELNCLGERFIVPPYGLDGGSPGGCNGIYMKVPGDNDWKTVSQALDSVSPSKFHDLRVVARHQFQGRHRRRRRLRRSVDPSARTSP